MGSGGLLVGVPGLLLDGCGVPTVETDNCSSGTCPTIKLVEGNAKAAESANGEATFFVHVETVAKSIGEHSRLDHEGVAIGAL